MLRRCDRYVLREAIGPFLLALGGLVLFILLNIILSLSDLMVDRGISMSTLLRLILLKIPSLLVVAVPMSGLFATFLALGRMAHDREILAFESLGIPLRRILLPLIVAAAAVGIADFGVYNWVVPASEAAYQSELRGVIFRQGVPRITANAFFKGQNDQFFYIRRYDESSRTLYGVVIYDTTGRLFPQAGTQTTMITAEEGLWTGGAWTLSVGTVYGFDREGRLVFTATVESLVIPIESGVAEVVSRSRTPSEMGIAELSRRIEQARRNGQRVDEYMVESNLKLSLPLATLIFVLLGGALSLAFLPSNRAVGIVLGLLLVAVFQGFLWWTQTLGRRGAMDPTLAAWLPDIVFGVVGLCLFARVDRLASRDVWSRWRSRLPFLTFLMLVATTLVAWGEEIPLHIECDELYLSDDGTYVRADGAVRATLNRTWLAADRVEVEKTQSASWRVSASGSVSFHLTDQMDIAGDSLEIELAARDDAVIPLRAQATGFEGWSRFTNSEGADQQIYFRAASGEITFDDDGEIDLLEAFGSEVTTCDCCGLPLERQPYSLKANRLLLYPDRLLVAFGLTVRTAGLGILWLPIYLQPLEETLDSPLFPSFGSSTLRGWFVKWNVPFYLTDRVYGTLLVDYFSRYAEIGVGGTLRYTLGNHSGRISAYVFPAKVGDSEATLDATHTVHFNPEWQGVGRVQYGLDGDDEELSFSAKLLGNLESGDVTFLVSRTLNISTTTTIEEKLPELSLSLPSWRFGSSALKPKLSAGWYREWVEGADAEEWFRLRGQLQWAGDVFTLLGFRVGSDATAAVSLYGSQEGLEEQETLSFSASARREGLRIGWTSTFVRGASPFEFDSVSLEHILTWSVNRDGLVDLTVSGSYDLSEGPGSVTASAEWEDWASWDFYVDYEPDIASLSYIILRGDWRDAVRRATWKIPYDAVAGEFDTASFDVSTKREPLSLSVQTDLDLNALELASLDVEAELMTPTGWGLTIGGYYSASSSTYYDISYGVFKDIGGCLRVGVEQSLGEIWLYVSILAFPEAVLRYAPSSSSFEIGD